MLLLLMLACQPQKDPSDTDFTEAETDWIQDLDVAVVEGIGTTLAVSFTTAVEGSAWVEYAVGDGDWQQTPPGTQATAHRLPVLTAPYADVALRVVASLDGVLRESGTVEVEAGGLPPEAPVLEITIDDYTPPEDALLLMSIFGETAYVVMMEFDGTMRWARPHAIGDAESGLGVQQSINGGLLMNAFDIEDTYNETSELYRVSLLGEVTDRVEMPGAHHFFSETPSGEILWLRYDIREVDGVDIVGDEVMMLPASGGESVSFANLWDILPAPQPDPGAESWDWTHANWLIYSPIRESYLVSTARENTLIELAPDGSTLQTINGRQSSLTTYHYADTEEAFEYPHGVHWDNGGSDLLMLQRRDAASSAVRYVLDEQSHEISRVWSFGADFGYDAQVLGEVQQLSDGNHLVSWGGIGILQVVSPNNTILWEAQLELGRFFSHINVITDPYNAR
ncbi:MAG: hypothetical protein ACI8S6_001454 [Myxococcota bacterium]|jgi:hypothetical protein